MRIPSGVTDQYLYFVAVDSSDLITRETGLTTFTVYRARNGAAAAVYTTPTVAEVSSANMPGVYSLLLDEDMTIGSGNDSEEVVLHITQASMAPVTLKFELYRNVVTAGNTLDVTATGAAGIDWGNIENPTTTVNLSATNIDVDQVVASVSGAVGSVTGAVGSVTGAVGSVTGNVGGNVAGSVNSVTTVDKTGYKLASDGLDLVTAWTVAVTGNITGNLSGSVGSVTGLTPSRLDVDVSTRMPTTHIAATAGKVDGVALVDTTTTNTDMRGTNNALLAANYTVPDNATIAATDGKVDAIKAKTDSLTYTVAGQVDANLQYVNDVQVNGTGASGDEWGPV
jgi:hypothetical protein